MAPVPKALAVDAVDAEGTLQITSASAANEGAALAYARNGDDASPPLQWSSAPEGSQSFVIIVDDPDAASPKPTTHWIDYDIPASVTALREGMPTEASLPDPMGMKQGTNSVGSTGYTGPKPTVRTTTIYKPRSCQVRDRRSLRPITPTEFLNVDPIPYLRRRAGRLDRSADLGRALTRHAGRAEQAVRNGRQARAHP